MLIRDGFIDRYTSDRLVFPPVLRVLSEWDGLLGWFLHYAAAPRLRSQRLPCASGIRAAKVAASLLAAAAACAPRPGRQAPELRSAAEAIYERYAAALKTGDADAWAAQWTEDGVQMPPDGPAVVGRDQIRENLRAVLATFRVDMQIRTEEVRAAGDWAFARGTYTATLTPKEGGGAVIPIDGKFLTILARQPDGSWKIHRDIFNSNVPPTSP